MIMFGFLQKETVIEVIWLLEGTEIDCSYCKKIRNFAIVMLNFTCLLLFN